jgi:hypothetical protein
MHRHDLFHFCILFTARPLYDVNTRKAPGTVRASQLSLKRSGLCAGACRLEVVFVCLLFLHVAQKRQAWHGSCRLEGVGRAASKVWHDGMKRTWISPVGEVHDVSDADLYAFCNQRGLHYDNRRRLPLHLLHLPPPPSPWLLARRQVSPPCPPRRVHPPEASVGPSSSPAPRQLRRWRRSRRPLHELPRDRRCLSCVAHLTCLRFSRMTGYGCAIEFDCGKSGGRSTSRKFKSGL